MLNTMDYLEREGYAERTPSPTDRRARIITVTAAGAGLVAAGHEVADGVHREVLDALPAGQREAFTAALTSLVGPGGLLAERRAVQRARCAGPAFPARSAIFRLSTSRLSVTVSLNGPFRLPGEIKMSGNRLASTGDLVRGVAHRHP